MQLKGILDDDDSKLFNSEMQIANKITEELKHLLEAKPKSKKLIAGQQLYNDISAIIGTIYNLLQLPRLPSQPVAALLRTLMESCYSIFAFCKNPEQNASLYLDFPAVLQWKYFYAIGKNLGSPFYQRDQSDWEANRQKVKLNVIQKGKPFLKDSLKDKEEFETLLDEKKPWQIFRGTWYHEKRNDALDDEMKWLDETFYSLLCSAVHSDAYAHKVLSDFPRSDMQTLVFQFWGAAMYKFVEVFEINLPASSKGSLGKNFEGLLWKK